MANKIMHILLLSCAKATELMEKKFHFKLSVTEKFQLELHKIMCDACKRYEKHSGIIEEGIKSNIQSLKENPKIETEDLKNQIKEKLGKSKQ